MEPNPAYTLLPPPLPALPPPCPHACRYSSGVVRPSKKSVGRLPRELALCFTLACGVQRVAAWCSAWQHGAVHGSVKDTFMLFDALMKICYYSMAMGKLMGKAPAVQHAAGWPDPPAWRGARCGRR